MIYFFEKVVQLVSVRTTATNSVRRNWLSGGLSGCEDGIIAPGSPWENGYNESFNSWLRDEFLSCECFCTLKEAQVLIEDWRVHYHDVRPRSVLGAPPSAAPPVPPHSATLHDSGWEEEIEPLQRANTYLKVDYNSGNSHLL